jgi:hypothetical protein
MNSIRRRYVLRYEEEDNQPVIMNWRHNTIKFTHEVGDNETLCFLDTQTNQTCRQKTHIHHLPQTYGHFSRYIPIESHHSLQNKSAAFNSTIHRLVTTPLSPDDAKTEPNEIKTIAKINGYSEKFVDRIHNKYKKKYKRALKPDDLDSCFERRQCTDDEKTCHQVLFGHHKQTTKDFP